MRILKWGIKGPFRDEQAFKKAVLSFWKRTLLNCSTFEIENEEKEPGMPDVISVSSTSPAIFTEFKVSDSNGVITFQKTQPAFYKRYCDLFISVIAWDAPRNRVVLIGAFEVVKNKSLKLKIPEEICDFETIS